jgi:hypothetical protein
MSDILATSLGSPMVLCFVLGIVATVIRSDLKLPDGMYLGLTIYLLFAIGLKGGMKLSQTSIIDFYKPGLAAIIICCIIPLWTFMLLHKLGKFNPINAAALSAHFGSVSAVTFSQSIIYVESLNIQYEGFMPAILAIMEVPAILVALYIAGRYTATDKESRNMVMHELLTGRGLVLLVGGLIIGMLSGKQGYDMVAPLFDGPFKGVLCLFLLEVGLVTGRRIPDLKRVGFSLVLFSLLIPVVNALLGGWLAKVSGLSQGGAIIFSVLSASASYIAAPAAVRIALPDANPGYYLTAALAIAFPFNVTIGIPLYTKYIHFLYHI